MFDVVALGESLIDFTPNGTNAQGIELFARNPGGAPANVLAMNARLGGKTAFIGKVGKDGFGDFLRQTLVESSIDVSGLVIDEKDSLLSKYPYEMDLVSGRYTIDAKSLLGIYSLDLSNPLTLVIYSDSCEELLTQLHALLPDCIV